MKTNITLKLDADLLRDVRILAAEKDTSISAMLAARLEEIVRERKSYERARQRALARLREGMDLRWVRVRVTKFMNAKLHSGELARWQKNSSLTPTF